ncbi:uncharacterized protein LOC126686222 [Mercurialis annua]|uniref:uncharacterized protein LOC126686222 n=1 Tax=Mercurialis annua TaxID=3986 RepID=UPI00215E6E99|nr:uncharacterized protein LOC126686222 [Mercurialis annua]
MHKQLHRALNNQIHSPDPDHHSSTFYISNSPSLSNSFSNLDRIIESLTPTVPAHCFNECLAEIRPYFCLGDLWESFKEWSVYGVRVPLLLSGNNTVKQYYVPSLSGIQLYVQPNRLRKHGTRDSDVESSRQANSACSSDREAEKLDEGGFQRHSLKDQSHHICSSGETENSSSQGLLVYEYLEQEQPHHRKPLFDKISTLVSKFPDIECYKSCDLLPASWFCVAWYPIYRIPMGPTLQNLDASFLTFHSLSTRSKNQVQFDMLNGRRAYNKVASNISLPVLGLASYKLRGSILTSGRTNECQHENLLLQAADNLLQRLDVNLPDFQFFTSHTSKS